MLLAGWGENGGSCLREICTEKKRSHQRCFLSNQCLLHKENREGLINMVHFRQGILPHIRIHIWFCILWICKKLRSVYFPIPLWFNFTVNRFEIDCMPLHWSLFIYEFAISQKHFNSISQKAGWKLIEHHSDCTGFKRKCRQQISKNLFWWRKKFSLERPSC